VESIEESAEVNVIHQKIIDAILEDVQKNPRVSFWSARTAAVLRFLRKTEPEFSISSEASLLMEEAVKEKYPEIWEMFEEHL
jgi:histone H3/H4